MDKQKVLIFIVEPYMDGICVAVSKDLENEILKKIKYYKRLVEKRKTTVSKTVWVRDSAGSYLSKSTLTAPWYIADKLEEDFGENIEIISELDGLIGLDNFHYNSDKHYIEVNPKWKVVPEYQYPH